MLKAEIIEELKQYFGIYELVDKATFDKFGDTCWQFADIKLLETLLFIRKGLDKRITINNWYWGGGFSQRGLRTNICDIVKAKTNKNQLYLSAHVLFKAIDFDVRGMTADEVRQWIVNHIDELPHKIRLEHKINKTGKTITWVHLDVYDNVDNPKIYLFNI